jgi:hypothetical protein
MQLVSFARGDDSVMATEFKPPYFKNANGADLLLYPAFVAARVEGRFALLDIRKIDITTESTQFIVQDGDVPSDAQVVGNTWQYVNKDGDPDGRFSNNPTIPLAQYCKIFLKGEGLNEAWMVSNADAGVAFGESFQQYKDSLTDAETEAQGIAPPTAEEWPELDLPDRPTPPSLDWKTPLIFYGSIVVIGCLLIVALQLPFSSVEDRSNVLQKPLPRNSLSSKSVSLINRTGESITCPAEIINTSDSKSCIGNAERQGFVRMPYVSAGILLDWNSKPVKVVEVRGAAAQAGLRAGDLLVELDGNKIIEPISLFKIIGNKKPGDYIIVRVVRGGKPINLTYRLTAKN